MLVVPAHRRRTVLLALGAALLLTVVLLAAVQVRAGAAQERRDTVAAQIASDRAAAEAEADRAEAVERAAKEAAAAQAEEALATRWASSLEAAQVRLVEADAVLAASAGAVGDDAVRQALAVAMDAVTTLLAGEPAPTVLDDAVGGLVLATQAVEQAHTAWTTEQEAAALAAEEAAAAQAAQAAAGASGGGGGPGGAASAVGGPPSTGAGPDCGGPESYEPPENDGPTFYTSTPTASGDGSNGRMPLSAMSRLGWCTDSQGNGQWLRSDAAEALTRVNEAFRAVFGENIAVDMSYRSYEDQDAMREHYGSLAARPGTSNHGFGLAFDTWEWQAYSFGMPRYEWLVAQGPAYGWIAPSWARAGGSNPEYWHFEYVG